MVPFPCKKSFIGDGTKKLVFSFKYIGRKEITKDTMINSQPLKLSKAGC
jgi:hypothetical protein